MADGDIKSVRISVTASTTDAERKLSKLATTLESVSKAADGLKKAADALGKFTSALEKICSMDLSNLASQIGRIAGSMRGLGDTVGDYKGLNAAAKYMNAVTRSDAEKRKNAQQELQKQRLALAEENAKTAAAKEARLSQAMDSGVTKRKSKAGDDAEVARANDEAERGISIWNRFGFSVDSSGDAIDRLTQKIGKGLRSALSASASALLKFTMNLAAAPWKRLGKTILDATKRLHNFLAAVKRIAVYRAIRWALKAITQALQEGIQNLYQYSLLINGTFARSMDMLATSALYAKNSLAAMVAPIIDAVAPAIDALTDSFVDLLNVINETFAALTGAETWTAALKYPKQYAEAADDASGSAKKLRATLLGFDEINRLDDNRKGSRGSAAEELDYSKMFEQRTVTNKAKGFIDTLKKAFKSADFTDIGKRLGEKLKKGLDKIPWDDIKTSVNNHATMVGTLLNGLVDVPGLGTSIGKSIAEAFNTAVGKLNTFLTVVDWAKVGKFLADGVNGFLKNFQIEGLGKNLAKIINSGVTLLKNFITEVDWLKFGQFLSKGINSFFTEVNLKDLGRTISKGITNSLAFISEFLRDTDFEEVGKSIASFFTGLDWVSILSGLTNVLFNGIRAAFRGLIGMFEENAGVGLVAAIAVANCISKAFGMPKVTSIISNGLLSLLTDAGTGAATTTATSAAGAAAAGGLGIAQYLGAAGIAVTLAAVAVGAAWTIGKYTMNKDIESGKLGLKEPYAGAIFDMENDFEAYQKKMYNLAHGRDLNTTLTVSELKDAKRTYTTSKMYNTGADDPFSADMYGSYNNIADAFRMEFNGVGLNDFPKIVTSTQNTEAYSKDIKEYTKKTYNIVQGGFSVSGGTGSSNLSSGALLKPHLAYASGGTPDTGSVFLAGESGAELVYSSASGTHVANRDQIAESVAIGNEESNDLLRELLSVGRSILAKDTTVVTNITTGQITSALDRQNRRSGRAIVPVGG